MRLTTVTVGVPVFHLEAAVKHSIVRKPTVFERMVLRLSRRGQENRVVGDSTLRQAFEDHLGVQGLSQLLETTVSGLVRLGVVSTAENPAASLLDQPIRAVALTPEGEAFYNKNTLPSSPTEDAVHYWYAPWSHSLSESRPGKLTGTAPGIAFDDVMLRPRDPSSLVRREIEDNRPRFLKAGARIITVDAAIEETVRWLLLDVEIHASPEGYLDLRAHNKSHENWLTRLEPSVVREAFLDAAIAAPPGPERELPRETLAQAKRLALATGPFASSGLSIDIASAGRDGTRIRLDLTRDGAPRAQDGAGPVVITCPVPSTVPPQLVSVTVEVGRASSCLVDGDVELTWSGGLRRIRVQAELNEQGAERYWRSFSDDLAATLASSTDWRIATVPFSWGSDRPIASLESRLAELPLAGSLEMIRGFLEAVNGSGLKLRSEQAIRLVESIAVHIEGAPDAPMLDMALVGEWLRLISRSLGSGTPVTAFRRALLSKATPPESALEVRQLLALEQDPRRIPRALLGPKVLAAVLEGLWSEPQQELPTGDIDGLRVLDAYRADQATMDASLGRRNADLAATSGRVVAEKSVGEALRAAQRWLATVDDPKLASVTGGSLPDGLVSLREHVRSWCDAAAANLAPALEPNQVAWVFDSNTLLDQPAALRSLTPWQVGVVPHRVIQELDGLKRSSDETIAQKARAANRTIDELREEGSLRFESARRDLVPLGFGPSDDPDNEILSVAIALSRSRVTLVTADKNLRTKAEASNIEATSWPSLQKGRGKKRR